MRSPMLLLCVLLSPPPLVADGHNPLLPIPHQIHYRSGRLLESWAGRHFLSRAVDAEEKVAAAPNELTGKASALAQAGDGRLVSLDTFRGFIMFWIIGGEALAVGLQALKPNFLLNTLVYELNHTPWQGLRFYDCIWPSFMLMVGMSVP